MTKLIIMHHDFDHMGSAADLKSKYPNIKILASEKDESYINGKEKSLRLQQTESIIIACQKNQKNGHLIFKRNWNQ
ncbi:MBL fold metallo-hydrolase [Paraclostridium benzoelyticum]|uniref:MBL fold metallo-hydrolase n=1 Tax=Paraclostridium benzoelyticum TaxID=1629550 RepID=UPI0031CCEDA1